MEAEQKYTKVKAKDLQKHGTLIGKELHLKEGIYTKRHPITGGKLREEVGAWEVVDDK